MIASRTKPLTRCGVALIATICLARSADAYIDLAPTLAKITTDSKRISVVEVVGPIGANAEITLKDVRVLKGDSALASVRQTLLAPSSTTTPRPILQWAAPGARGVLFGSRNTALVCIGESWYQVRSGADGSWKLGVDRPDLPLAYSGRVSKLADSVEAMLAGKETVLTVVAHGADDEAASFDLALNRQALPDGARIERIRATLNMPGMAMAASASPAYMIGLGPVDAADAPKLIEALKSADAGARADAADDLRRLGSKAGDTAAAALAPLLDDASPRVRSSVAAAILQTKPNDARALAAIAKDLDGGDAIARREAARAAGFLGTAAEPMVGRLATLLKDPDEATRVAAVQSIALLGRVASGAATATAALLDEPGFAIDAADALGRIGPAARPALPKLAAMLSSDQYPMRWAAVRAMSQIGGPDAHPAVDFMVKALPNATEVEGYNMMIYLSLLGPVANDASAAIRENRIKNPALPTATLWAISKEPTLPWLAATTGGMPGGFPGGPGGGMGGGMGGPPGGGGFGDIFQIIYHAYVRELGDRLTPNAVLLANKILDGSAGTVPAWGYEILSVAPAEVHGVLKTALASDQQVMRERATVALGFMGRAAAPAANDLRATLARAESEPERRLVEWAIRETSAAE